MRLLLVEDDVMIGESVLDLLRADGFAVDWVKDGEMGCTALVDHSYDLILLDLGLPKLDGLAFLGRLREAKDRTPVLIVTARDALDSRVEGLNSGADDYIVKPYEYEELLARIRALIRRSAGMTGTSFTRRNVSVELTTRIAMVDGQQVVLHAKEWGILEQLLARPGQVLSRRMLENKLYGWKDEVSSNAVEVYVHGIRKKLGPDFIQNIRGVGYMVAKD